MADQRLVVNPYLEQPPDYTDDVWSVVVQQLVNAQRDEEQARQFLLNRWTASNADRNM